MFGKTKKLSKVENAGGGLRRKAGDVSKSRWRGGRYKMMNSVWEGLKLRCCGPATGDFRHNSSRAQERSTQGELWKGHTFVGRGHRI